MSHKESAREKCKKVIQEFVSLVSTDVGCFSWCPQIKTLCLREDADRMSESSVFNLAKMFNAFSALI